MGYKKREVKLDFINQPSEADDFAKITPSDPKPMLSLVVPAYNEAEILAKNIDVLCRYMEGLEGQYRWEFTL